MRAVNFMLKFGCEIHRRILRFDILFGGSPIQGGRLGIFHAVGGGTVGVLVKLREGSAILALERVLELIVGGGTDGGVLMSDRSMAIEVPSVTEW